MAFWERYLCRFIACTVSVRSKFLVKRNKQRIRNRNPGNTNSKHRIKRLRLHRRIKIRARLIQDLRAFRLLYRVSSLFTACRAVDRHRYLPIEMIEERKKLIIDSSLPGTRRIFSPIRPKKSQYRFYKDKFTLYIHLYVFTRQKFSIIRSAACESFCIIEPTLFLQFLELRVINYRYE